MKSFKIIFIILYLFNFSVKANNIIGTVKSNDEKKTVNKLDSILSKKVIFKFEDKIYTGLLDVPNNEAIKSLIVLVPGSGKTKVYTGKWNYELRKNLNHLGVATFAYDKSGCGASEGKFDYNQSIENSSEELLAAIQELRNQKVPGSQNIGLWGISRAGWICPTAIKADSKIKYWISISGPNHLDNMYHLLKTNWTIKGKSSKEIETLSKEWKTGFKIQRNGGTYLEYLNATPTLHKDNFIKKLRGKYTEEKFLKFQKYLMDNNITIDKKTGLQIMLNGFEKSLEQINIPVLAILGEKDSQIDWKETINLYKKTINKNAPLKIKTLPNCNHFIRTCETGGYDENYKVLLEKGLGQTCNSYYDTIKSWLLLNNFWNK